MKCNHPYTERGNACAQCMAELEATKAWIESLSVALDVRANSAELGLKQLDERIEELEAENAALKALLKRYRNETPLGHQPHMIAHEVDGALSELEQEIE